ncbi:hypothetical protein B566_EDAN001603 [Ephemera danica]|nr:hypothetical protein B566_EDAN001603 [Ephemera danica]
MTLALFPVFRSRHYPFFLHKKNMDSDSESTDSQSSDVYIPPRHPYPYRNPRLDSLSRFVRSFMRTDPEMSEQLITSSNSELSNDDTSESESTVGEPGNSTQNFDVELPTRHTYLGNDLTELSGYTMYDEGSIVSLPLLIQQHGAVALPGQALPLSLFHPPTIAMVRKAIEKDHMFGLVPAAQSVIQRNRSENGKHPIIGAIGVTAEVYEHSNFDEEHRGYGVKARCRQRFKVIEVVAEQNALYY